MDTLTPVADDTRAGSGTPQPPDERQRYAAVLAGVAGILDEHPEIPQPDIHSDGTTHFCVFSGDVPQIVAAIRRAIGGKWDKKPRKDDTFFDFTGEWHGSQVLVSTFRDTVCRKVVKGTREVTKTVQDPEALAKVPMIEVTETEEDIEWVCEPLLAPRPAVASETPDAEVSA